MAKYFPMVKVLLFPAETQGMCLNILKSLCMPGRLPMVRYSFLVGIESGKRMEIMASAGMPRSLSMAPSMVPLSRDLSNSLKVADNWRGSRSPSTVSKIVSLLDLQGKCAKRLASMRECRSNTTIVSLYLVRLQLITCPSIVMPSKEIHDTH